MTTLICNGDSWTAGHLVNPVLRGQGIGVLDPLNDEWRLPQLWPHHLGLLLGENTKVENIAYHGCSNDQIIRTTIAYITDNYLIPGKPVDDIFVVVGWSSPCRKEVVLEDGSYPHRATLWPHVAPCHVYEPGMKELFDLHVKYFWSDAEIFGRYVSHNLMLQTFCNSYGIRYLAFNAFYEYTANGVANLREAYRNNQIRLSNGPETYDTSDPELDKKLQYTMGSIYNLTESTSSFFADDLLVWQLIDNVRYYNKDDINASFMSTIPDIHDTNYFNDYHPTAASHKIWADELCNYIKRHNLL